MFRSFIAWLDSYMSREEPSAILKAIIGLMAFAGLLGTIFGNQAIRTGAFVAVVVFVVSTVLLLLADRRHLKLAHDTHRFLLARYCDFVIDNSPDPLVLIEIWKQKVYIAPNGDMREVLTLSAVALREKVYFIRLKAGSGWNQPDRYRRGVRIIARSLTINGSPGPRWHVTTSWLSGEKMTSIIHLHHPLNRGERLTFEVVRTWPAKSLPLIKGRVEDFSFRTTELLEIQKVEYSVILPAGFDAIYELIGVAKPDVQISADAHHDPEGRKMFTWQTEKLPPRTEVGMRLELR